MPEINRADIDAVIGLSNSMSSAPQNDVDAVMRMASGSGDFDPNAFAAEVVGQDNLAESDSPIGLRAIMSVFGDTDEEREAAFRLVHPSGDLIRVPTTGDVIYRTGPGEQYRKLDPGFFESFKPGLGAAAKEFAADIADFAGDAPEIAGETLGLLVRRSPGAGKFFTDAVRGVLGGMVGEEFQQRVQTSVDTQRQTRAEQRGMVVGAGVESLIGTTIGSGISGGVNFVRGRGLGVTPEGAEAMRAAERLGTSPMLPQQVSDQPFVRILSRQSQALLPTVQRYLNEQEKRTALAVKSLADPSRVEQARTAIAKRFSEASDALVDIAVDSLDIKGTSARFAGRRLQQGVDAWWRASGQDVDNLYAMARSVEEPQFDIAPLKFEAAQIEAGVPAVNAADGSTFDVSRLDPELQSVIRDIAALEPGLPPTALPDGTPVAATDQLRALRKRLDDLTLAGPEGPRQAQAIAGRMRSSINRVLENPANTSEEFRGAWKIANATAAKRFATREKLAVVDLARSETPAALADRLAKPGQVDNLAILRKAISAKDYERFSDFFKSSLLSDPANMKARLEAFDDPTLSLLVNNPSEKIVLRKTADALDALGAPQVQELFERQTRTRSFVSTMLNNQESRRVTALADMVNTTPGGKGSEFGKTVRSAIIDEIWNRSKSLEKGVERVDFNRLSSALKQFEDVGLLDILDPREVSLLRDAQWVQDFSRFSADAGTSIQAAQAAADIRVAKWSAISTFIENYSAGRFMTSELGRRVLVGKGLDPADARFYRVFGQIATDIASSSEAQQEKGQDLERLINSGLGMLSVRLPVER